MSRRHTAFTSIELLVVVAVILILLSLVLPMLAKARELAKRSVCTNNLHMIGVSMHHYLADNDDWFPGEPGVEYDFKWYDRYGRELRNADGTLALLDIVWCYGGKAGVASRSSPPYRYADASLRPFNRYLAAEYYECPSDRGLIGLSSQTMHQERGTSYSLNGYNANGYAEYYEEPYKWIGIVNRRSTDLSNDSCIIAGEAVIDEYFTWPGGFKKEGEGYGIRWHDEGSPMANVVFIDAAVRYVRMTATVDARVTRRSGLYWWEGLDYSFCPTARQFRRGPFWKAYRP